MDDDKNFVVIGVPLGILIEDDSVLVVAQKDEGTYDWIFSSDVFLTTKTFLENFVRESQLEELPVSEMNRGRFGTDFSKENCGKMLKDCLPQGFTTKKRITSL